MRSITNPIVSLAVVLTMVTAARAEFDPVPLTPGSFNKDLVVEKTAPPPIQVLVTANMDAGTNIAGLYPGDNGGNQGAMYEKGTGSWGDAGLPYHGTVFNAVSNATHQFRMAPDYTTNNVLYLGTRPNNVMNVETASLTVTTPAAYSSLSFLSSSGNGPCNINYLIYFSDGSVDSGSFSSTDWFSRTANNTAWACNGMFRGSDGSFQEHSTAGSVTNRIRLFYNDVTVNYPTSLMTNITFTFAQSSGRTAIFGVSGSTDGVNFTPLDLAGFNHDMILENSLVRTVTATMDGGVFPPANTYSGDNNTWFERGFNLINAGQAWTGLPLAGSLITAWSNSAHQFQMAASYTANCAIMVNNQVSSGTFTLTSPTALGAISILSSCGSGPVNVNLTINHQDGSQEFTNYFCKDWFANQAYATNQTVAFAAAGRVTMGRLPGINNGGTLTAALVLYDDIQLTNTTSPVTSIQFSYVSGGRASVFGVSGSPDGANYTPLAVTGYNVDNVVEATAITNFTLRTFSSATMDGGTNNTGNTWYEKGWNTLAPDSGLPPAGSTITSTSLPDHHYVFASSYTGPNGVYCDSNNPAANILFATPKAYSGISFLSANANGAIQVQVILNHQNGSQETNVFNSQDWFDKSPVAFTAFGRCSSDRRSANNFLPGTTNPRLYEAQFALQDTVDPVVGATLIWTTNNGSGGMSSATSRFVVMGVSGTSGALTPIIRDNPANVTTLEGSNVVLWASIAGGATPMTFAWYTITTNGVMTKVNNGGPISNATTTNLTFTGIGWTNSNTYVFVASNIGGSVTSLVATVAAYSSLPDVTQPGDPIAVYQPDTGGGAPPAAEGVEHAIENLTSKYLNRGSGLTPFSGPAGLIVYPPRPGTILNALRVYTANDAEGRDPADYLLEGSRNGGLTYTTVASGPLGLPAGRNAAALVLNPLTQALKEVHFANTAGYTSYRLSFATVKGNESAMQLGEVELLGLPDPNAVPTIVTPPVSIIANENSTVKFSVTAVGPGTIGYQWVNVTAGDPGTPLAGENSSTLTLANVTSAMSGNIYRVVVTNEYGGLSAPSIAGAGAQLTVNSGAPTLALDLPTEGVVYAGRTAVLPVNITGTEPFTLQWKKDAGNLNDTARLTGSHSNILSIADAQLGDSGSYQLAIHSALADIQSTAEALTVQTIPALTLNGAGWALKGTPTAATIIGGVLELSASAGNTARSAWYNYPLYIGAFKATFLYQDVGGAGADGMAFVLQNDPRGTNALGGAGGVLAYGGIVNSAALQINIYANNTPGIAFHTNGATGGYSSTAPVNPASGDPIWTEIVYQGGVMSVALSNTVNAATFTTNLVVGDLTSAVGTDVAWVGFTAADGGTVSMQNVSGFKVHPDSHAGRTIHRRRHRPVLAGLGGRLQDPVHDQLEFAGLGRRRFDGKPLGQQIPGDRDRDDRNSVLSAGDNTVMVCGAAATPEA